MAVSKRTRYEVLRRDNHTCRYCHATDQPLTVDHVTPTALGGTDSPDNLVAACRDCNAGKSSTQPDQRLVADVSVDMVRWAKAMRQAVQIRSSMQQAREEYAYDADCSWIAWEINGRENPPPSRLGGDTVALLRRRPADQRGAGIHRDRLLQPAHRSRQHVALHVRGGMEEGHRTAGSGARATRLGGGRLMPREYAAVNVSIWQDEDWRALPPTAQHLYLTLWTHPKLSYCGVVDWRPGRIAASAGGWTADEVRLAADCLRARHFIVTDDETEECLIRSWVRWDGLMKQPRMAVSYANAFAAVASNLLRRVLVHELVRLHERQPDLAGFTKPQVQAMFDLPEVSAKDEVVVEDPFGDGFAHRFGHSVGDRFGQPEAQPQDIGLGSVSLPPTPSPTPAPLSITPPPTGVVGRGRHAIPLPEGWTPSEESRAVILSERPTIDLADQHRRFVDWQKATGKTMKNWDACWRNWMRKATDYAPRTATNGHSRSQNQLAANMAGWDAWVADEEAREERKAIGQ